MSKTRNFSGQVNINLLSTDNLLQTYEPKHFAHLLNSKLEQNAAAILRGTESTILGRFPGYAYTHVTTFP